MLTRRLARTAVVLLAIAVVSPSARAADAPASSGAGLVVGAGLSFSNAPGQTFEFKLEGPPIK